MTRRRAVIAGLAAAAVLVGGGLVYEFQPDRPRRDAFRFRVLDDEERAILGAIAPVILDGALPADATARDAALVDVVRGFDTAVAGLPPAMQAEVAQLFAVLRFPLARMIATGVLRPWSAASQSEVERFLHGWRYSPIVKLRSAYDALHQLAFAAWYGNPASWARLGYPGPPVIR